MSLTIHWFDMSFVKRLLLLGAFFHCAVIIIIFYFYAGQLSGRLQMRLMTDDFQKTTQRKKTAPGLTSLLSNHVFGGFSPLCSGTRCLWLYSAFTDPRAERLVRIIAVGERWWRSVPLICLFQYNNTILNSPILSVVNHLNQDSVRIHGFTIKCRYPSATAPDRVTLALSPSTSVPFLRLTYAATQLQRPGTVAACLAPLHNVSSAMMPRLIEWFEFYRMMGVSHFVAYNWSAQEPSFLRMLNYYQSQGVLEVLPWRPPVAYDTDGPWPPKRNALHYYGQMSANNDCMYRLFNRFQWQLYCDFDEFLVPRFNTTLPALAAKWFQQKGHILVFRSADFDLELPARPIKSWKGDQPLRVLNYTWRRGIHDSHYRSKIIVDVSQHGESMGVHKLFEICRNGRGDTVCFYPDDGYIYVSPKSAVLHHYRRIRDASERTGVLAKKVVDSSISLFADRLERRVKEVNRVLRLHGTHL